jgi:hypothetical protein
VGARPFAEVPRTVCGSRPIETILPQIGLPRRQSGEAVADVLQPALLRRCELAVALEPLEPREATLASLVRGRLPGVRLTSTSGTPATSCSGSLQDGLEGIVSKRLGSRYRSGRSPD